MAEKFKLKIISPDNVFYEGEATFLEFTSVEGEMGVYKDHVPLTTILEPCIMNIHDQDSGEKKQAAVYGGFIEILKDRITVLAEGAQWPEEIDLDRAKEARKRAEERLAGKSDSLDVARAELALKRALVRIDIKE